MARAALAAVCFAVVAALLLASVPRSSAARDERAGPELMAAILSSPSPLKSAGFFKLAPKEIASLTEALITRLDANLNRTAASVSNPSWDATMGPSVESDAVSDVVANVITFPSSVSPDKAARDASLAAADRISAWSVDASLREDVYAALKAFNRTPEARALTGERRRYLDFALRDARRSGLELPKQKRDELAALLKRASKLGLEFSNCLDADTTALSFAPAELNGTTEAWRAGHKRDPKDPSKLVVTVKYPDYRPVMEEVTVEATRKRLEFAYNTVCAKDNTARLDELIRLRADVARLLGYPTWSAFAAEVNMAKTPERISDFLGELGARLRSPRDDQIGVVLALKRADKAASRAPFDPRVRSWEATYYMQAVERRDFDVDQQLLREYFPLEHVLPVLLQLYQEILGLRFERDAALAAGAWAPGVDAYQVYDASSGARLGAFFLDLHPRDGKYGHAAMFPLQSPSLPLYGSSASDSAAATQQQPKQQRQRLGGVGALVCNFPASTPAAPSLLPHSDVVTLFHEFGHVMHQVLAATDLARFAGTSVERDFVEAPSQMLENWCWQAPILKRLSKHHKTGAPLPDDLIERLAASRNANGAIDNSRQLALGTFDQAIHTGKANDSRAAYAAAYASLARIVPQEGTAPAARFGHMVGYDARYYSYLWSEVYSADMFRSRFLKDGLTNATTGVEYRQKVLARGGSADADDMLRAFLGRAPTQDAFLAQLGLVGGGKVGGGGDAAGQALPKRTAV